MASSLSNIANNLSEGIHRIKCKFGHNDKRETCGIKYSIATVFSNIQTLKMISYNTNVCIIAKIISTNFDEKLRERFFNSYKFSKHDNNKFILSLRKGVYPYEYIDDWKKLATLPEIEDFYSHLVVLKILLMQITRT